MNDFVGKPVAPDQLETVLDEWCANVAPSERPPSLMS